MKNHGKNNEKTWYLQYHLAGITNKLADKSDFRYS